MNSELHEESQRIEWMKLEIRHLRARIEKGEMTLEQVNVRLWAMEVEFSIWLAIDIRRRMYLSVLDDDEIPF